MSDSRTYFIHTDSNGICESCHSCDPRMQDTYSAWRHPGAPVLHVSMCVCVCVCVCMCVRKLAPHGVILERPYFM